MTQALGRAGVTQDEVDWICAHGTGTPLNDVSETRAIKLALGEHAYRTPVSSIKGALGHTLGASGAISGVAAVQAILTGIIPPTLNYDQPDPDCDLDYVPNAARTAAVKIAMVNAFGFGGQNASLVFREWTEIEEAAHRFKGVHAKPVVGAGFSARRRAAVARTQRDAGACRLVARKTRPHRAPRRTGEGGFSVVKHGIAGDADVWSAVATPSNRRNPPLR